MAQKEANPETQNNAVVEDELTQEIVESNIKQLEAEIKQFKNNLDQIEKSRKNYKDQWEIDKELYEMQLDGDNFHLVTPTHNYQKLPRYWYLVKQKIEYKFKEEVHMANARLEKMDLDEKTIKEQLKSSQDKLNELKEE